MRQLYGTTALALVVPHYAASCMAQGIVPHLILTCHTLFRIKLQYHELLICAYEVSNVITGKGFGWRVTPEAAYASAFWGAFKTN